MRSKRLATLLPILGAVLVGCSKSQPEAPIPVKSSVVSEPAEPLAVSEGDWPWWRGIDRNACMPHESVPVEFSSSRNVLWKAKVPGRGHADPTIVGERILLATADEDAQTQSVVCYDRQSGKRLWIKEIHKGGLETNLHSKNTQASSTVASDGHAAFVAFLNNGTIQITALDFEGKVLWQTTVGRFHSRHGYSASPAIWDKFVIVAADHSGGGYVAALHRKTGEIAWRTTRPTESSFASPIVAKVAGMPQLLLAGCDRVVSLDPATGKERWNAKGTTTSVVGTMVFDDDHVYASGGFPEHETLAVVADGSEKVAWRNRESCYVTSMLLYDGNLYAVDDKGIAQCWKASNGKRRWRKRIGEPHSASPVLIGDSIYAASERGTVSVFKADPKRFTLVAKNRIGNEIFASPVGVGGRLYLRVAHNSSGRRQETLYCIGSE